MRILKCKIMLIIGLWLVTTIVVFSLPPSDNTAQQRHHYQPVSSQKTVLYSGVAKQNL